jgi:hypothetical protein
LITVLELEILDRKLGVFPICLNRDAQALIRFEEDLLVGDRGLVELAGDFGRGSALVSVAPRIVLPEG